MTKNNDRSQEEQAGFIPQPWPMYAGVLGDDERIRVYLVAGWVGTVPRLLPFGTPLSALDGTHALPPDQRARAGDVWVFGHTAMGVKTALDTERDRRMMRGH